MTDVPSASVLTGAVNTLDGDIWVSCKGDRPFELILNAAGQLMASSIGPAKEAISYRIDRGKIQRVQADKAETYIRIGGKQAEPLIAKMLTSNRIAFEAHDFRGRNVQLTFELKGLSEVLPRVRAGCSRTA